MPNFVFDPIGSILSDYAIRRANEVGMARVAQEGKQVHPTPRSPTVPTGARVESVTSTYPAAPHASGFSKATKAVVTMALVGGAGALLLSALSPRSQNPAAPQRQLAVRSRPRATAPENR
jgi:hypothetical protein